MTRRAPKARRVWNVSDRRRLLSVWSTSAKALAALARYRAAGIVEAPAFVWPLELDRDGFTRASTDRAKGA